FRNATLDLPILKTFYWKEGSQMGIIAWIVLV
ncbi:hypothetical protein SEEK9263_22773, partial [Salmonella enterica subsp. enterica serovar Kentucky str. ATCC 9263]